MFDGRFEIGTRTRVRHSGHLSSPLFLHEMSSRHWVQKVCWQGNTLWRSFSSSRQTEHSRRLSIAMFIAITEIKDRKYQGFLTNLYSCSRPGVTKAWPSRGPQATNGPQPFQTCQSRYQSLSSILIQYKPSLSYLMFSFWTYFWIVTLFKIQIEFSWHYCWLKSRNKYVLQGVNGVYLSG